LVVSAGLCIQSLSWLSISIRLAGKLVGPIWFNQFINNERINHTQAMTLADLNHSDEVNETIVFDLARKLRAEICRGRFEPGDKLLPERELANRYTVNRTSVREALKILQKEGFIHIRRGGGAIVQPIERVTLGALHHLLFIDGEPQVELIEQLSKIHRILLYGSIEMAVENASEEQLGKLIHLFKALADILEPVDNKTVKSARDLHIVLYELFGLIVVASKNLVLRMIYQSMDPVILSDIGKYRENKKIRFKSSARNDIEKIIVNLEKRDGAAVVPILKNMIEVNIKDERLND